SEVGTGSNGADFLHGVLSDIRHEHVSVFRIPEKTLTIANAVGIDFTKSVGLAVIRKRIRRRSSILSIRTVRTQRIDSMNLAERDIQILAMCKRISSTATVGQTKI